MKKRFLWIALAALIAAVWLLFPAAAGKCKNKIALENMSKIPGDLTGEYTFAFASDCRENTDMLAKVVESVNKDASIQWLIFGGDIVYNSDPYEYRRFIKTMNGLKIPWIVYPGNHEMRGLGKLLFRYYFGKTYFHFRIGADRFICLDNSNEKSFGWSQKRWFKNVLAGAQDDRYRFVFFHVPLFDDRTRMHGDGLADENPAEAEKILDLMIGGRVTRIFASHLHGYYDGSWRGVPYVISAGAGSPLHPEPEENSFFNYIKVRVTPENHFIEVIRL